MPSVMEVPGPGLLLGPTGRVSLEASRPCCQRCGVLRLVAWLGGASPPCRGRAPQRASRRHVLVGRRSIPYCSPTFTRAAPRESCTPTCATHATAGWSRRLRLSLARTMPTTGMVRAPTCRAIWRATWRGGRSCCPSSAVPPPHRHLAQQVGAYLVCVSCTCGTVSTLARALVTHIASVSTTSLTGVPCPLCLQRGRGRCHAQSPSDPSDSAPEAR